MKVISCLQRDSYWRSADGRGREELLWAVVEGARQSGWNGIFDAQWETWDVKLLGGRWFNLYLRTASEELGRDKLFTRVRCSLEPTRLSLGTCAVSAALLVSAALSGHVAFAALAVGIAAGAVMAIGAARQMCLKAVTSLVWRAGIDAGLQSVTVTVPTPVRPQMGPESAEAAEALAN